MRIRSETARGGWKRGLAAARHEAEADWKLSPFAALLWFCAPLATLPAVALLWWLDKPLLRALADEDGPFEWAQVVFFLCAALACAGVALHLLSRANRCVGALFLLLSAGLLFIAGEELAWGQRLLFFDTPEALAAVNAKREVSLHNIASVEKWFTLGKLAAGLYGAFGAWLLIGSRERIDWSAWRACVVPVFLSSPFLIVLAMRMLRLSLLRHVLPAGYGEYEELLLAFGFAAFSAHAWRARAALAPQPRSARPPLHLHPKIRGGREAA